MKKLCAGLMFCLVTLTGSVCSAQVIENQIALGSVRLGWPKVQVENQLGNPTAIRKIDKDHFAYDYGGAKNFSIIFSKKANMAVEVYSGYKNGMPTPNGIGIGSTEQEIVKAYGPADYKEAGTLYYYAARSGNLAGIPAMQFNLAPDAGGKDRISSMRLFIK